MLKSLVWFRIRTGAEGAHDSREGMRELAEEEGEEREVLPYVAPECVVFSVVAGRERGGERDPRNKTQKKSQADTEILYQTKPNQSVFCGVLWGSLFPKSL